MTWLGGVVEVGRGSSGSRRWKFRWQPQAAHFREVGSAAVEVGDGMNSPQPSRACRPRLAAWFFRHSLYATTPPAELGCAAAGEVRWRLRTPLLLKFKGFTEWTWIRVGIGVGVSGSGSGDFALFVVVVVAAAAAATGTVVAGATSMP